MKVIESKNNKTNIEMFEGDICLVEGVYYILSCKMDKNDNWEYYFCSLDSDNNNLILADVPDDILIGTRIEGLGIIENIFDGEKSEIRLFEKED